MAKHTVDLEGLLDYKATEKIRFASSSVEKKQLYITLRGSFEVWHDGKLVLETMQPYPAVEKYNEL